MSQVWRMARSVTRAETAWHEVSPQGLGVRCGARPLLGWWKSDITDGGPSGERCQMCLAEATQPAAGERVGEVG